MKVPRAKLFVFWTRRGWRWKFVVNGRIMAASGDGYTRRRQAWRAWDHFSAYLDAGAIMTAVVGGKAAARGLPVLPYVEHTEAIGGRPASVQIGRGHD